MSCLEYVTPKPPRWAVESGLSEPRGGESFVSYCERIGLTTVEILSLADGLTERTAILANGRLAAVIRRKLPAGFDAHVRRRFDAAHEDEEPISLGIRMAQARGIIGTAGSWDEDGRTRS